MECDRPGIAHPRHLCSLCHAAWLHARQCHQDHTSHPGVAAVAFWAFGVVQCMGVACRLLLVEWSDMEGSTCC